MINKMFSILSSTGIPLKLDILSHRIFMAIEQNTGNSFKDLDSVYHSNTMHEMQVNADLYGVNLCDSDVLLFLAMQTAYHHAFWPHTAKRFIAFKNILRKNRAVQVSLKDGKLLKMLNELLAFKIEKYQDPINKTPGSAKELMNIKQLVKIVKEIVDENN